MDLRLGYLIAWMRNLQRSQINDDPFLVVLCLVIVARAVDSRLRLTIRCPGAAQALRQSHKRKRSTLGQRSSCSAPSAVRHEISTSAMLKNL